MVPRASLPLPGELRSTWDPTFMNIQNYRAVTVAPSSRLPLALRWLVSDGEWAMGLARNAHGHEWGDLFWRSWGLRPDIIERVMAAWLTWRQIPVPEWLRPVVARAPQPPGPPTTTGHLWKCGPGPGSPKCCSPATLRIQLQHLDPTRRVRPQPATLGKPVAKIPQLVQCVFSDPAEAAERSWGHGGSGTITGRPAEPPAGACGQTSGTSLPANATASPGLRLRTTTGRNHQGPGQSSTSHRGGEPPT